MSEPVLTDKWLTTALAGIAPGGVHSDVAPPTVDDPYISFSLQDADDLMVVGGARVWTDALYLVKVVAQGDSYVGLNPYNDLLDAALHNKSVPVTGGQICWCRRERPVRYSETTDGVTYKHLGGLYRIQVREE